MITAMKNETTRKLMVALFIGLAFATVFLAGCNTVRGVAKDVTDAANALDPDE